MNTNRGGSSVRSSGAATTSDAGLYQAPYLIPGTYQVSVEMTGYKKYIRDGIILRVNDLLEIDISLEVGTVDQAVTVTGDTPSLETASSSLGQVVDGIVRSTRLV